MSRACVVFLLLLCSCGESIGRGDVAFPVGTEMPSGITGGRRGEISLVWILGAEDYLRCETHAREIRHVQAGTDAGVRLRVLSVGGRDEWLQSFVRRERLSAEVTPLTVRDYVRHFGQRPHSALYVISGSRVVRSFSMAADGGIAEGELLKAIRKAELYDEGAPGRGHP
jgi:hypothetical protein